MAHYEFLLKINMGGFMQDVEMLNFFSALFSLFREINIYFYTFSSIVQGFVALVAFLGVVVIFKIQLEDQAMQKICDKIEPILLKYYKELEDQATQKDHKENEVLILISTPTQILKRVRCLIDINPKSDEVLRLIEKKLDETLNSRNENREKFRKFSQYAFFNIGIALVLIPLSSVLISYWFLGMILFLGNIVFSLYLLKKAYDLMKRALGGIDKDWF